METITLADYVLYGFLAFIGLMLVAMFVALLRLSRDIGEVKGDIGGINKRLDDLTIRVEKLEQTVLSLVGEIGETKGMVQTLSQKVDMLMSHRHTPDTGQVILTPEEIAAD